MATSRVTGPSLGANDRGGAFLSHFGVREQPFGATPDPVFLFSSRTHRTALESMIEAINCNLGFTVLFGAPGMGKTTLLFQLLTQYRNSARTAFIFQTQCNRHDLLRHLASEFELPLVKDDEVLLHRCLKEMLVNEAAAGRKVLIIVDEAQNLQASSLEAIRLLSDFETTKAKLLHIILAGSARLSRTLRSPGLLQLTQRISTICRLEPLGAEEVKAYVDFRLRVAGFRGAEPPFSSEALAEVALHSAGVPRLINSICYWTLAHAYTLRMRLVGKELVQEAARRLDLSSSSGRVGDLVGRDDSTLIENEKEFVTDPWPAVKSLEPQSVAGDLQQTRPEDPKAAPSASQSVPIASTNQTSFKVPERAASTILRQESFLQAKSKGTWPIGNRELPRYRTDYASRPHGGTLPVRSWKTDRVTLVIGAFGILALSLWLGWYDPLVKSEVRARHSAIANSLPGSLEGQYRATTNNLSSSAQQAGAPEIATEQQNTNQDTGPAGGKALKPKRTHQSLSIVETVPFASIASKLNRRFANEGEATTPQNTMSWHVLPASPLDLARVVSPLPSPKVNLQPVQAAANAGVPESPLGKPIKVVKPEYPRDAQSRHIEGEVLLELQVDSRGKVRNVLKISGQSMLAEAAEEAARQWLYPPFPDNQAGRLAVAEVRFNFKLSPGTKR